jgi:hypothetical protein
MPLSFLRLFLQLRAINIRHRSVKLIGLRIFFKYNAGDSFSMDVPFGNKELIGIKHDKIHI